ncbi:MAG: primary replicative DNA helicase [Acidobacteria bacterium OLB17]|nr:MAG: primary replicative DNA helicase [Acidobacteria bacterium OLB17]MCZ2389776.1 replicative DNA helicase [Acidobacteriota bacterium]
MEGTTTDNRREQYLEKPLPSSEASERVILGAILLDSSLLSHAIEHLKPEDFYSRFNRSVFVAMLSLFEHQKPIEAVLIGEELRKEGTLEAVGGTNAIANLAYGLPHLSNIDEYIKVVHDRSVLRQLIRTCNAITSEALEAGQETADILDHAEQQIFALAEARTRESFARIAPVAERILARVKEHMQGGSAGITGLTTGFTELDNLTSGFQRTDLIIIAGRPSMGKTALCLTLAQNAALKANAVVAVFSLEMSKEQLVTRMLASEGRINAHRFRSGHLVQSEWERLASAISVLSSAKIFIDDTPGISVMEMRAKCRRLIAEQKALDLIVVDYLQLMGGSKRTESRQQEVSQISRELKALAKELDVPVVALSQLSRASESRNPPTPVLSDLRESGSIEQDADVVGFIYRPEYYDRNNESLAGLAELIIAKQRNGPTGTVNLAFIKEHTRFENLARPL